MQKTHIPNCEKILSDVNSKQSHNDKRNNIISIGRTA